MRIFSETICWTNWVQCFDEWTLIYILTLSFISIVLIIILLIVCNILNKVLKRFKQEIPKNKQLKRIK